VEDGVTGGVFPDLEAMVQGLDGVMAIDRARVHARAVARFGVLPMVDGYVRAFRTIIDSEKRR